MTNVLAITSWTTAATFIALAALHLAWGHGWTWPSRTRTAQARLIGGADTFPGLVACYVVSALLVGAAGLIAASLTGMSIPGAAWLVPTGIWTAAVILAGRGILGLLMHKTPQARSAPPEFLRWNARLYSPLCLVLAAGTAAALL